MLQLLQIFIKKTETETFNWVSSTGALTHKMLEVWSYKDLSEQVEDSKWIQVHNFACTSRLMVVSRGAKKKQAYATNQWVIYR